MTVIVDLPAVRTGRAAAALSPAALTEPVRALRPYLRAARSEAIDGGVRIALELDLLTLAGLAEEIRALANRWPFLSFKLLAEPPAAVLEVTGTGPAAGVARAVFGEVVR